MLIKYDLSGNNIVSQSATATYTGSLIIEYVNGTNQALMVISDPSLGLKTFSEVVCSFSFFNGTGTSAVCSNKSSTGFFNISKYDIDGGTVTMNAEFEMIIGHGEFVVKNGTITDLIFDI